MMNRKQSVIAFGTLMVALLTALILLTSIPSRRRLLEETDTELDKAYFKGDHKMCCGNFRFLLPFQCVPAVDSDVFPYVSRNGAMAMLLTSVVLREISGRRT
jgi:hypothetical protein